MQHADGYLEIVLHSRLTSKFVGILCDAGFPCEPIGEGIFRCFGSSDIIANIVSKQPDIETQRYLDHYLLVFSLDAGVRQHVVDIFFEHIATEYEKRIDLERNRANVCNLLNFLKISGMRDRSLVVDYGCGTGISANVSIQYAWRIVGVDRCHVMRSIAASKGMTVLAPVDISQAYPAGVDAAFCSYVLHLVFDLSDIKILWDSLRVGGILVANFHKGSGESRLTEFFTSLGAQIGEPCVVDDKYQHGLYRSYVKD
jgi:SAM-dependent methyltransferase